jgi:fatty acid desaturase
VCTNSKWNSFLGGFVINLGMGGCAHWWKTKHNQHHATPNKMNEENTMVGETGLLRVYLHGKDKGNVGKEEMGGNRLRMVTRAAAPW